MNSVALRHLIGPLIIAIAVIVSAGLFMVVMAKGLLSALSIGVFAILLIVSFASVDAAFWSLILAALFEALYKGASASVFTLLVKDFFLAVMLLRLFWVSQRSRDFRWLHQPLTIPAAIFTIYCAALIFAPSTRSVLLAFAGFRAWILWMPVYFPVFAYFSNKAVITKFLLAVMLIQLPISLYGIIQGNIGYEHTKFIPGFYQNTQFYGAEILEPTQSGSDAGSRPLMNVRACSIYTLPATLGSMAALTVLLSIGILAWTSSQPLRLVALCTALAGAGALLASGSRAPMISLGAGLLVMTVMSRRRIAVLTGALVIIIGSVYVLKDLAGGGAVRLEKRLSVAGSIHRTMAPLMLGIDQGFLHPFGNGIATGIGVGRVFSDAGLATAQGTRWIENEYGRALMELGLVGAPLWLFMLLTIAWQCGRATWELGDRAEGALCVAMFSVMVSVFVQLSVGSALYGAQPGLYFWIFAAAIIRLREFASAEPTLEVSQPVRPKLPRYYEVPSETRPQLLQPGYRRYRRVGKQSRPYM